MSNTIKIPHTVTFLAEINIDTIPANLLPTLLALSEEQLTAMVKETTIHAINHVNMLDTVNEGHGWAFLSLAE